MNVKFIKRNTREAPLDIAAGDGRSSASNVLTRAARELLATFEHVVMMLSMSASKLPLVDRMLSSVAAHACATAGCDIAAHIAELASVRRSAALASSSRLIASKMPSVRELTSLSVR